MCSSDLRDRVHPPVVRRLNVFLDRAHAIHFRKIGMHVPFHPFFQFRIPALWRRNFLHFGNHKRVRPRIRVVHDLPSQPDIVHRTEMIETNNTQKPEIIEDFLTINEYSRPGEPLQNVNNLFVHYTANPETSAAQNRSYFENLGITGETSASAHFVIGYDGEIIQCIPLNEIAYAVMQRNYDSVSIECCYLQEDGKFTDATYRSLIQLCAWLLNEYDLAPEDMRRHYDEGGKKCPQIGRAHV